MHNLPGCAFFVEMYLDSLCVVLSRGVAVSCCFVLSSVRERGKPGWCRVLTCSAIRSPGRDGRKFRRSCRDRLRRGVCPAACSGRRPRRFALCRRRSGRGSPLRYCRRLTSSSSGTSSESITLTGVPFFSMISSKALACTVVRGKPSKMLPLASLCFAT